MEMTEKAKRAEREYKRQWRAKNKDKVKQYNIRYWEKKAKEYYDIKNEEKNIEITKNNNLK